MSNFITVAVAVLVGAVLSAQGLPLTPIQENCQEWGHRVSLTHPCVKYDKECTRHPQAIYCQEMEGQVAPPCQVDL